MPVVDVNPEIAKKIFINAESKGISVEIYLREIIESEEDEKIAVMREAVNDKLFMADLSETLEDFKYTDFEERLTSPVVKYGWQTSIPSSVRNRAKLAPF